MVHNHWGDEVTQIGSHNIGMIKYGGAPGQARPADRTATAARQSFDVCLIIPRREEFDYARDILHFGDPVNEEGYFIFPFSTQGGAVRGCAVVLFEMGLAASAAAAARLLSSYDIRVLALAGTAGALSEKLRLGDVVIASSVDEYLHGARARPDGAGHGIGFELGGVAWQATPEVVTFANNFRYLTDSGEGFAAWRERARERRYRGLAQAIPAMAGEVPDYLVGAVATGEIVSTATAFARWLRQTNRFRVAIEMEAGGAARAIYRDRRTHLIVVRGISDFADERKQELDATAMPGSGVRAWQRYATQNAVDLLATLVASPRFPWPSPAGVP